MNISTKNKIKSLRARKILDSRGRWTVEVDLETSCGLFRDSAPCGASKGKYEARTVSPDAAVENINRIADKKLKGESVLNQQGVDRILQKLNIGANATTPVSMAVARAAAGGVGVPLWRYLAKIYQKIYRGRLPVKFTEDGRVPALPQTCFNLINGGIHAENDLDFQEFMVVCSIERASVLYQKLRQKLGKNVGDEGGFVPRFQIPEQALELLKDHKVIIDAAASQFYTAKKYKMKRGIFTPEGLIRYYQNLIKKYPIVGLEDPFAETDLESWRKFNPKILVIGDDLLATHPQRIKMAKEKNLCNALLLKINQIGTVSEALEAAKLAQSFGWKIMVSHRSGETNDDFIADFAVGIDADYIKAGAPARGERVAKYNRLLRIKEEIKN